MNAGKGDLIMWSVTESQCTDGVAWIVKTPGKTWEYTPFETEAAAQAYAARKNAEEAEREAEEADPIEEAKALIRGEVVPLRGEETQADDPAGTPHW
jgi:hypothetical protein